MTACEELIMSAVRSDIASDTQPSAVSWAGASYPDLAGQVAVITGGSRGIGAATARAFAANGMAVAVVGRDEAAIAATVDSIRPLGPPPRRRRRQASSRSPGTWPAKLLTTTSG